mgnify:FL=1
MAYLYNYVGDPSEGQRIIRKILTELYKPEPDGISGNEDCGQMSAWYIMSSMGIYPLAPGSAAYDLGAPLVDRAKVILRDSTELEIIAHDNSPSNKYVQRVVWNGETHNKLYIEHSALEKGGVLEFYMGSKPLSLDKASALIPLESTISDFKILPSPAFSAGGRAFQDKTMVSINSATDASIHYKRKGIDAEFIKYDKT